MTLEQLKERRRSRRSALHSNGVLTANKRQYEITLCDLSLGGSQVQGEFDHPPHVGDTLELTLTHSGFGARSEVVWTSLASEQGLLGLRFMEFIFPQHRSRTEPDTAT